MKTHSFLTIVVVLFTGTIMPNEVLSQPFPRNTNQSRKFRSSITSGYENLITSNSRAAVISGGAGNTIAGAWYSFIGGGDSHQVTGENCVIGGGTLNVAGPSRGATVSGGLYNEASGENATVPGGYNAKATHSGSFVWSADSAEVTSSFGNATFTVRCEGGARFYTANGTGTGVWLKAGLSSWDVLSDSNAKTKVTPVSPREVLAKLAGLPVSEWEYKSAPQRRFFGPMAQDFHASFGLGDDDKTINTLDADGVLFLSVKGLVEELKERDKVIEELKAKSADVDELKAELRALRDEVLGSLPPAR